MSSAVGMNNWTHPQTSCEIPEGLENLYIQTKDTLDEVLPVLNLGAPGTESRLQQELSNARHRFGLRFLGTQAPVFILLSAGLTLAFH